MVESEYGVPVVRMARIVEFEYYTDAARGRKKRKPTVEFDRKELRTEGITAFVPRKNDALAHELPRKGWIRCPQLSPKLPRSDPVCPNCPLPLAHMVFPFRLASTCAWRTHTLKYIRG